MKDRVVTGVIIGAVFAAVIVLSLAVEDFVFDIFVLSLMLVSSFEVKRVLEQKSAKAIAIIPVLAIFFGYAVFYALQDASFTGLTASSDFALPGFFCVLIIMFFAAVVWTSFDKKLTNKNLHTTTSVLIYPIALLSFMLSINYIQYSEYRSVAILLLFLTTTFSDVFALMVGMKLKGPKLAPKISPKKTISGAIGGLCGGMIAGLVVYLMSISGWFEWLGLMQMSDFHPIHFIIIGLFGSIFTQAGDLLASYVKRRSDVKDYGKFLKGHGGVMDRIDGMMLNAVIINLYMMLVAL